MNSEIKRLGMMGGSFNPIHNGHMNAARGFIDRLNLDKLLIVPVNSPPHKSAKEMESAQDRLSMCRLAAKNDEKIEVSDIEIRREGLSYTKDTLRELKDLYPNSELFLITGTDMFLTLDEWKGFDSISKLAVLCACARNDGELKKLRDYAVHLEKDCGSRCQVENIPVVEVSSTEVREGLESGKDVSELVDRDVLDFIVRKGLYKK